MTKQIEKEKEYLYSVFKNILPNENPFITRIDNNYEIFVICAPKDTIYKDLDKSSIYRELYSTALDLRNKIEYALELAINLTYTEEVLHNYNLLGMSTDNERIAYYNIENALFRVEALWDILAHFYNIKYELGKRIDQVYHNRIFSNKSKNMKSNWNNNPPDNVKRIISYLTEKDDTEVDGEWKGNYQFINSLRNNMTHKFSISRTTTSSYAFEVKYHPSVILKRLCENLATVENFIYEICEDILEDMVKSDL